jgi:hypothetical protein
MCKSENYINSETHIIAPLFIISFGITESLFKTGILSPYIPAFRSSSLFCDTGYCYIDTGDSIPGREINNTGCW